MNLCSFIVFLWFSFEFSVLEVISNHSSLICTLKGRPGVKLGKHIWDLFTWAQENVMIHLLTETMSTSYTYLNICLSHFSQSTDRAWLGERNLFRSTKIFFFLGGGLGVWEFCRLSLVPQKKKKKALQKFHTFCQSKNSYQSSICTPYSETFLSCVGKGKISFHQLSW